MKIINAHLHLPEIDKMMEEKSKYLGILETIPSFKDAAQTLKYLTIETVLGQMDEAGIAQSVLFACYAPIVYASNEFVAAVCAKFPDRFIGFASIDPRDKDAPQVLEHAVQSLGLRGLKLHPPLQDFFANDRLMWPVYEKAAELDIPVVFHVGSTPFGALAKLSQANPLLLDDVAVAFPTLKIMLTHLGTLWQDEAFMVVEKNPNVYIDTAAYPYEIKELLTENLVRRVGEDKFIFGTDFPMPYEGHQHRMKDFVETVQGLALSPGTLEKIFSSNFERMLSKA
jgi:uncharacterized protein